MLSKCINCGFRVSDFESQCLNCGRQKTWRENFVERLRIAPLPFFFAAFFSAILAFPASLFWYGQPFNASNYLTFAVLIFIFLFLLFFRLEIKKHQFENERVGDKTLSILDNKRQTIEKRLAELDERERKINAFLDEIKIGDDENLQEVRGKLLSDRETVNGQAARYELQKNEIEKASKALNVETSLADFSESFDELEREYNRLLAESESNQNPLFE